MHAPGDRDRDAVGDHARRHHRPGWDRSGPGRGHPERRRHRAVPTRSTRRGVGGRLRHRADETVVGYISTLQRVRGDPPPHRRHRSTCAGVAVRCACCSSATATSGRTSRPPPPGKACSPMAAPIFTGRVPHDEIERYYRTIDMFVVPRTNDRVSQLVTPLKPYEAMAMEKAVIVSSVGALAGDRSRGGDRADVPTRTTRSRLPRRSTASWTIQTGGAGWARPRASGSPRTAPGPRTAGATSSSSSGSTSPDGASPGHIGAGGTALLPSPSHARPPALLPDDSIAYANNKPGLHTLYEVIGADAIARWHRMLGDDTRFLTGTDEHSINIAQARGRRGPADARVRRREGRAVQDGRGRPGDRARPVHPDDRPGPRPRRPGDGPPGPRQRRHLPRHVRGLVLPERGLPQRDRRRRDAARHDLPEPSRRAAPVADRAELVLPPVGLPGAPRAALRRAPRLRPARVPAQRDARLHPRWPRGLLDQPRADARRLGDPVPDRRERRDGAARGRDRGTPRRARSTSGTTRSSTTSPGAGFPDDPEAFAHWWPADLHIIGKDIARFHTIFWPAMLWSAGLEAPRQVWVHGWLLAAGGERMSKSRGNFLDPNDFVAAFGADGARYVVLREVPFDRDAEVSWDSFVRRYNADLANDFGNLVNRTVSMTNRYLDGERPAPRPAGDSPLGRRAGRRRSAAYRERLDGCLLHEALGRAVGVRRRRPTRRSTPSSRGSWPRRRRRATRRRRRGCATCWATSSRRAGWSGWRRHRSCPAPRRGCSPSSGTPTRTRPTATAARRSSTSWRGAPRGRGRPGRARRSRSSRGSTSRPRRRRGERRPAPRAYDARVRLVDSHCHLNADRFEVDADRVVGGARGSPASSGSSSRAGTSPRRSGRSRCVDRFRGWTPRSASTRTMRPRSTTPAGRGSSAWARDPRVVAIGETGLDYDRVFSPIADQLTQPAAQPGARARDRQAGDPPLPLGDGPARCPGRARRRAAGGRRRRRRLGGGVRRPAAGGHPLLLRAGSTTRGDVSTSGWRSASRASSSGAARRPRPRSPRLVAGRPVLVETDSPFLAPPGAPRSRNEPEWVRDHSRVARGRRGSTPDGARRRHSSRPTTGHSRAPGGRHDNVARSVTVSLASPGPAAVTWSSPPRGCLRGVEPEPSASASAPSATASAPATVRPPAHRRPRPRAPRERPRPTARRAASCRELTEDPGAAVGSLHRYPGRDRGDRRPDRLRVRQALPARTAEPPTGEPR